MCAAPQDKEALIKAIIEKFLADLQSLGVTDHEEIIELVKDHLSGDLAGRLAAVTDKEDPKGDPPPRSSVVIPFRCRS